MRNRPLLAALVTLLAATALAGCSFPRRDLEKEEVRVVGSEKEMMWFLQTVNAKGLDLVHDRTVDELDEEAFLVLAEMGRRTPWAARRLSEPRFSRGTRYNALAAELHAKADVLYAAARIRDGARTHRAALEVERTCQACHALFRQ